MEDETLDNAVIERSEPRVDGRRDEDALRDELLLLLLLRVRLRLLSRRRRDGGGDSGGVGGNTLAGAVDRLVREGERGRLTIEPVLMERGLDGGRYVMPMPLCRPVRSSLGARSAMVTSPARPFPDRAGTGIRWRVSSLRSSKRFRACTLSG